MRHANVEHGVVVFVEGIVGIWHRHNELIVGALAHPQDFQFKCLETLLYPNHPTAMSRNKVSCWLELVTPMFFDMTLSQHRQRLG